MNSEDVWTLYKECRFFAYKAGIDYEEALTKGLEDTERLWFRYQQMFNISNKLYSLYQGDIVTEKARGEYILRSE